MALLATLACSSSSAPGGSSGGGSGGAEGGSGGTSGGSGSDGIDASGGNAPGDAGQDADDAASACSQGAGRDAAVYTPDGDDPAACTASQACENGLLCIGINCDARWECFTHDEVLQHPCPADFANYCGCNGVTFTATNTCPDRPYEHTGACNDGVNCDPLDLRCSDAEPSCPAGTIASVVNGYYGPCVPYSACRCEFAWECPHHETYMCDAVTKRCALVAVTSGR